MPDDISLFDGAAWFVVFLFTTVVHEAGHAWAGLKLGDDTAHRGGQVSLDPWPHIRREPLGMVIVPILFYLTRGYMIGWASAPYDPHWASRYPKRAALMAMAGPAADLLVLICSAILIRVGIAMGYFAIPESISFDHVVDATSSGLPFLFATLLSITFSLNLMLMFFNLLPFPPLDGSCIPFFFLSDRGAEKYWELLRSPGIGLIGMVVAWKLFPAVYPPILDLALRLLYPGVHYS